MFMRISARMSIDLERILGNERLLRAVTSLSRAEFDRLLSAFEALWEKKRRRRNYAGERRQRAAGAGNPGRLPSVAHKLLFILFYFKCYPLQEVLALLFGFSQPQACEWVGLLTPLLNLALGEEKQLPARRPADLEGVLRECPGLRELLIDGTERPVRRPRDKGRRKQDYSGKEEAPHQEERARGGTKEKARALSLAHPAWPGTRQEGDRGGRSEVPQRRLSSQGLWLPGRLSPREHFAFSPGRSRAGENSPQNWRLINRAISSLRVGIEHVIASVKRCRILLDPLRNLRRGFADAVMLGACALHNLRTEMRAA